MVKRESIVLKASFAVVAVADCNAWDLDELCCKVFGTGATTGLGI